MPWRPPPSDRFYRFLVRTGLFLRWALQVRIITSGTEHLPDPGPRHGASRAVVPGVGAVFAITHFGYLDFAAAELLLWKRERGQLRFLIHQGAADHWLAGPAIAASGHVVVGYAERSGAYDNAVARLRAGEYLAVFPEAGVSRSFVVRECRTGAVRMAAEAGVPVIPVSVWGTHRLLTRGHGFSLRRGWRAPVRSMWVRRCGFRRTWTQSAKPCCSGACSRPAWTGVSRTFRWHRSRAPGGCPRTWAAVRRRKPSGRRWTPATQPA
ncbi:lysophospholipid acyltransferase family protein, partial [Arthrobacter nitrophenolicus]